ncbi:hypothetical protein [Sphingomonas profundi]|uniref:hypothetical protein n=1 Tax=Alterirhizorhabdus profundi TaxID=2681549 RepID=UPI0012E9407D|nr:hypothetical protein [Sphingomonas profundi]
MTKPRPPLSIDLALARIAGQIEGGWAEMARLVDRHESTVRRWGDEAQPEQLPLPAAIALDIAYERAGGVGQPIFQTYELQLGIAREHAFADQVAIGHQTCVVIRESGQAHEAMVLAALPSASEHDRVNALRELEDVAREVNTALALLSRARAPPDTS